MVIQVIAIFMDCCGRFADSSFNRFTLPMDTSSCNAWILDSISCRKYCRFFMLFLFMNNIQLYQSFQKVSAANRLKVAIKGFASGITSFQ